MRTRYIQTIIIAFLLASALSLQAQTNSGSDADMQQMKQQIADLQAQLEGSENRIAVERMRFNQAAQAFNTTRDSFPMVLVAGMFGSKFNEKAYFKSQPGAERPPQVQFSPG